MVTGAHLLAFLSYFSNGPELCKVHRNLKKEARSILKVLRLGQVASSRPRAAPQRSHLHGAASGFSRTANHSGQLLWTRVARAHPLLSGRVSP